MDGSSKNSFNKNELFRPASLSQALDQYVPMIYDMVLRKARVTTSRTVEGPTAVLVYGREGRFWTVRVEDYDKCLSITRKFSNVVLFPSSPQTLIEQIRVLVSVEFTGRE